MAAKAIFWVNDLSGSQNQHTTPGLLADNQSQIMVNISQTQDGSWSHRLGTDRFLELEAGAGSVKGLHMFEKDDGTFYLHAFMDGDLMLANETGGTWDVQEASVVDASSTVSFANFIGRHYFIGSGASEYLRYATETGTSSLVSGNIEGKYLASNGVYLMTAGASDRKNYWSNVGSDTFTTATDFVYTGAPATGIAAFGNNRPFIVFTENDYTIIDPASGYSDVVPGFGCSAHNAIVNIRGFLMWPSRFTGVFYLLGQNDAYPTEISLTVKNDLTQDAIINQIPGSAWANMAGGVISNRVLFSIGDLSSTVKGQTLSDCALEFDFAQQNWRTHTYSDGGIGSVFATYIDSNGDLGLYAGSRDNFAAYRVDKPNVYTDDSSDGTANATTAVGRTKHYVFYDRSSQEVILKDVPRLHFKYRAASGTSITVKYALDGATTYTTMQNTLPATTSGLDYEYAEMPLGKECKTISLQLEWSGDAEVQGIGFEVVSTGETGLSGL